MLLLLLALLTPAYTSPIASETLPDMVEKVMPSVVNISSTTVINYTVYGWDDFMRLWGIPQERKQSSLGSGFVLDNEGYILTNYHVVAQATEVVAILNDKRQIPLKIIGKDPKQDLALLQVRKPTPLTPARLGDSDKVRIAEPVVAIGNPFGLQHTVTMGIISAKNRTVGIGPLDNFLQTDAAVNPGNSGGPLFNLKGEVIGINTAIYSKTGQSGGVSFAIPINTAKALLDDLKRYGRVPRPWLGIVSEGITPMLKAHYELPRDSGVVVFNLVQRGPADRAGLRRGDIIFQAGGEMVDDPQKLERELLKLKPQDKLKLKVQRGPRQIDLTVGLEELPPKLDQLPPGII